ncbi:hypothetical protein [Poseidonibacter ostreae]|jgi:periplasmic protein CpxP/Spy|uniref:Uncharacterized protein n=1 Tax=Poseidonibacter ostreae TaxID=2654171 RepID=A0ABQ6VRV3_9BACT|nr:hypothetical protein [Poseidonibacter ostreae]KAB7884511.1 hypothetical protein GA417_11520 [Poseidonibacter ostreae]KAB7892905.1 hypothetical protein GBG18_00070 [Poseidonibacter ostreae]MAC82759.1 hypothetical protein [Arcobacter sp.]|tara:strand:- start:15608 stop:16018 length:411 start_codon:yes stop_codon:yes gene_type:complete
MKILKILMILCSLSLISSSFADEDYDDDNYRIRKHGKTHISRSLEHLNLNKNQYRKIEKILKKHKKDYKEYYKYKSLKQKELQKIMRNTIFDKEKYLEVSNEIKNYSLELEVNRLEKIHDVLNNKQKINFSYFIGD